MNWFFYVPLLASSYNRHSRRIAFIFNYWSSWVIITMSIGSLRLNLFYQNIAHTDQKAGRQARNEKSLFTDDGSINNASLLLYGHKFWNVFQLRKSININRPHCISLDGRRYLLTDWMFQNDAFNYFYAIMCMGMIPKIAEKMRNLID